MMKENTTPYMGNRNRKAERNKCGKNTVVHHSLLWL